MTISGAFNKPLTEVTAREIEGLLDGTINKPNRLYSEELTRALQAVDETGNSDLIEAFKDTARIVLSGENASGGGSGFSYRNSIGLGVVSMLGNGDKAIFERLAPSVSDPLLKASLKTLQAELKAQCIEHGIKVHSTNNQRTPAAPGKNF
jgi:hypothetical protein